MSSTQKIIKYLAVAFAIFLTFSIISGITSGFIAMSHIFNNNDFNNNDDEIIEDIKNLNIEGDAKVLDIDIVSSSIIIKNGDTFSVETSNKYISSKQDKNIIYITEKKHNLFRNNDNSKLIVYIPKDTTLDGVSINSGAGKVDIEELTTKILNLDLGAGKVNINNLNVLNRIKVDGGAGKLIIDNSNLNNLDLNMGVGKWTFTGKLSGKTEIDQGVGEANINLLGTQEDYQIHIDKGLGTVTIDGQKRLDEETVGNGINIIDIDGGVGSIDIDFIEKRD